ncbi:MAG: hypothetical protein AAFR24_17815 [Cyanobacteria bacterium J06627_3]
MRVAPLPDKYCLDKYLEKIDSQHEEYRKLFETNKKRYDFMHAVYVGMSISIVVVSIYNCACVFLSSGDSLSGNLSRIFDIESSGQISTLIAFSLSMILPILNPSQRSLIAREKSYLYEDAANASNSLVEETRLLLNSQIVKSIDIREIFEEYKRIRIELNEKVRDLERGRA